MVASYTVTDQHGASSSSTLTIVLTGTNDTPVANDDIASGDEDTTIAGNVLANDSDVEHDDLTASLITGPAHGSLTLNGDGSFSYTPDADWHGTDTFTYQANDGALDSNLATVTITVNPDNDAPTTESGDPDGDHRGQRAAADHPGRAAGQCQRRRRRQPDRH